VVLLQARELLTRPAPEQDRPRATYRTDLVTALLSVWFVLGLFLDAWAHNNLSDLETFLTPWHGVFYSGFVVTGAWICWAVLRGMLGGRTGRAAVPLGYGLGLLALPVFAASGAGDYAWHTAFGVETSLDILFSPTHLGIVSSMVLIVTIPLRSAWADPARSTRPTLPRLLPAVLGLSFATTLVLLFLQYANALLWAPEGIVGALSNPLDGTGGGDPSDTIDLVTSVVVTNVVLLVPPLLLSRRWRVPVGAATILYAAVAGLAGAITAFAAPPTLLAVLLAGVAVDALIAGLRPGPGSRSRVLALAGLAPLITWGLYLGVAALAVGRLPGVTEYWTGLPVVAALHGVILGVLAASHNLPAGPATRS
jgi:hypothetical protein